MEISIVDEISKLDEAFIEELCWEMDHEVHVSDGEIKKRVRSNLRLHYRFLLRKLKFVIVCCLLVVAAIPVCAGIILKLEVSVPVDRNNKQFIGTEVQDDYYITYNGGRYIDSNGTILSEAELMKTEDAIAKNRIVKELEGSVVCPSSFVEIEPISHYENTSVYPEMILVNDSVCILTKEDGNGWELREGDTVSYNFSKIQSQVIDEQNLIVGYIKDGMLCEGESFNGKESEYCFKAKEPGVYYIYLRSGSSDYLTLQESTFSISNREK